MAAMLIGLAPIVIPMIPELIKDMQMLIATMESGTMTPEQKAAAIADIKVRLADKQAQIEAYQFRNPA